MSIDSPAWTAQLSAWLAGTDIEVLELRGPKASLRLRRGGAAPAEAAPATTRRSGIAASRGTTAVTAPSVGTLLHRHPQREAALAPVGARVKAGHPLALLQIGPLLLPVPSPLDGVVVRHVAADGAIVGYGDTLIELSE
jgi:acetyl-CoA carboxylase biotin carboxyl carrier protein